MRRTKAQVDRHTQVIGIPKSMTILKSSHTQRSSPTLRTCNSIGTCSCVKFRARGTRAFAYLATHTQFDPRIQWMWADVLYGCQGNSMAVCHNLVVVDCEDKLCISAKVNARGVRPRITRKIRVVSRHWASLRTLTIHTHLDYLYAP